MAKRVTIIGGGSSMFVPHLLRLFMRSTPLRGSTICLMDVDGPRVEAMAGMARRLVANEGLDLTIEHTTEQRPSLVGSDYVIVAISVGGMAAWEQDIEIPGRYGIFTEVHDSIGPGGIMRAFRHVPVLADICRDLAEVSPTAWVFSLSTTTCSATASACSRMASMVRVVPCTACRPAPEAVEVASEAAATCLALSEICAPDWLSSAMVAVVSWTAAACSPELDACCWVDARISAVAAFKFSAASRV